MTTTTKKTKNEIRTLPLKDGSISSKHNRRAYELISDFVQKHGMKYDGGSFNAETNTLYVGLAGVQGSGYREVAKKLKEQFNIERLVSGGQLIE